MNILLVKLHLYLLTRIFDLFMHNTLLLVFQARQGITNANGECPWVVLGLRSLL